MAITLNGTTGISSPGGDTSTSLATTNLSYTGTLTGGTGVIAIGTNQIYKDASGNVGIGTTSPGYNVEVAGAVRASVAIRGNYAGGTDVGHLRYLNANGSVVADMYAQTTNGGASDTSYIAWQTVNSGTLAERMRLDSGNLLVGTTGGISGYFSAKVQIDAAGNNGVATRINTSGEASYSSWHSTDGAGTRYHCFFYDGTTRVLRGSISSNGTATSYNTSSDQRLKTNVSPAGSAIQSLLDFPVDQFDWIKTGDHQDFGAIAQKVYAVIPDMVAVPEDPDEMWGIDWSKAVPRLIKAIQELSAKVTALEAK